ncbi:MAG TPA: hypothetical protein VFZ66_00890 [Herpetosiphonaceae bacterium]
MSTWKQFARALMLILGYLVVTYFVVLGISMIGTALSVALSAALFTILQLSATVALFLLVRPIITPRAYREAQTHGQPATANVLAVAPTGWRIRRSTGWLGAERTVRREYQLRVQVAPPAGESYEATLFAYLEDSKVPKRGANISVNVHRQRPEIVVLAAEDPPA